MVSDKRKVDETEISGSSNPYLLPDDVVFVILLCLPADVLYNVMRFVCRQWYNIIKSPLFISSHLEKDSTTNGLLVTIKRHVIKPCSECGDQGDVVEVKHLNFPYIKRVSASCNGLLFVIGPVKRNINCPSYIINPVTKQYLPLPLFPNFLGRERCCFGYAAASRVYKVMHYTEIDQSRCLILTVGVDEAWRKVDINQLSYTAKQVMKHAHKCLILKGYIYWVTQEIPIILCFDMETETFGEIHVSPHCFDRNTIVGLVAMENSVCLWTNKLIDKHVYKFWLLKDSSGQFEQLFHFNFNDLPLFLKPIGWLRNRELLIWGAEEPGTMVYNVNTGKVHQTEEMKKYGFYFDSDCHVHVDSLVPLNNLSLIMTPQLPFKSPDEVYSKENMSAEFCID